MAPRHTLTNRGLFAIVNRAISSSTDIRQGVLTGAVPTDATIRLLDTVADLLAVASEAQVVGYARQQLADVTVYEDDANARISVTAAKAEMPAVESGETWTGVFYYIEGSTDASRTLLSVGEVDPAYSTAGVAVMLPGLGANVAQGAAAPTPAGTVDMSASLAWDGMAITSTFQPSDPTNTLTLSTSGTDLVDGNGTRVFTRGACLPYGGPADWTIQTEAIYDHHVAIFEGMQQQGLNAVRMNFFHELYEAEMECWSCTPGTGYTKAEQITRAVTMINEAHSRGLYTWLCMHGLQSITTAQVDAKHADTYPMIEALLTHPDLVNNPRVVFNGFNEPGNQDTTWADLQRWYEPLLQHVRVTCGFTGIVCLEGQNWAYRLNDATVMDAIENYDAVTLATPNKLAWAHHRYPGPNGNPNFYEIEYNSNLNDLSAALGTRPTLCLEWGESADAPVSRRWFNEYSDWLALEAEPVHGHAGAFAWAWAWSPNQLTYGTDYPYTDEKMQTLTSMGLDWKKYYLDRLGTTPTIVPSAPQNVVAQPAHQSVSLSWQSPSVEGDSIIQRYIIECTSHPGTVPDVTVGAHVRERLITGLTNGTTYTFTVKCENRAGFSPVSAEASATAELSQIVETWGNTSSTPPSGDFPWTVKRGSYWYHSGGALTARYGWTKEAACDMSLGGPNHDVECQVRAIPDSEDSTTPGIVPLGILFRYDPSSRNGYFLEAVPKVGGLTGGSVVKLRRLDGGSGVDITTVDHEILPNTWHTLKAVCSSSLIECYVDDVLVISHDTTADATVYVGEYGGVRAYDSGDGDPLWDNWIGTPAGVGGTPTTLVTESFDTTDSTTLGPNHTWSEWNETAGVADAWEVYANYARPVGGLTDHCYATCDTPAHTAGADHFVEIVGEALGTGARVGCYLRAESGAPSAKTTAKGVRFYVQNGRARLAYSDDAGAFVVAAENLNYTVPFASQQIRLVVIGDTYTGFIDGVQVVQATIADAAFTDAAHVHAGIYGLNPGECVIHSWEAGDV